jgi:hypothetical protein
MKGIEIIMAPIETIASAAVGREKNSVEREKSHIHCHSCSVMRKEGNKIVRSAEDIVEIMKVDIVEMPPSITLDNKFLGIGVDWGMKHGKDMCYVVCYACGNETEKGDVFGHV